MGSNLFGIGFGELAFIVILALIVFGPKRIPEVARTIGRFVQQVRQATSGIEDEMRQLMGGEGASAPWLELGPTSRPVDRSPLTTPSSPPPPAPAAGPAPAPRADESAEGYGDGAPVQGDEGPTANPRPPAG